MRIPIPVPSFTAAAFVLLAALSNLNAAAQPSHYTEQEVRFSNGDTELAGSLILPEGTGEAPFPAVVFVHGSGPMSREGFRPYAEAFARLGMASLFYDKRGTGASGGSWLTSSLDDLAGDAAAAVRFLRSRNDIDPTMTGFWGISQAGWIAPMAAAKLDEGAGFMIIISGGGASPKESEYYSYRQLFEQAGLSGEAASEAFGIIDRYFTYLDTGEGRAALVQRLEELSASPDHPLHRLPQVINVPSEENRDNWRWVAAYDPLPDIAKVRCPVLLLFGEEDSQHPTELAVRKWREGLAQAGNDKVTLMVFPGAGHGIRMRRDYKGEGRPPFADGYRDVQLGWLFSLSNEQ